MIGDVLQLMLASDYHKDYTVEDIDNLMTAAIEAGRLEVMYKEDIPVGMFSYTFLTPPQEKNYINNQWSESVKDIWKNNPENGNLYIIDFIAPHKNAMSVARFTQKTLKNRCRNKYQFRGPWRFVRGVKKARLGYVPGLGLDT